MLSGIAACVKGESGCTEVARAWLERLGGRVHPTADADGAAILYVSGTEDVLHTTRDYACNLEALAASGAPVEACLEEGLTHGTVVSETVGAARAWAGGEDFVCRAPAAPPACR